MSELTQCNYCSLRLIRNDAKREGRVVTLKPGGIGTKVFVHRQGEALAPWIDGEPFGRSNQATEMTEIPDSCCC